MSARILHFTLGPVQAFVADARRLRDFWAGSFLLSLLSGQAMRAVEDAKGSVLFPEVSSDPLFRALRGNGAPHVGSLPNRFKARVPEDFNPARAREAVLCAWQKLADAVWTQFVAPVESKGRNTREIWDRQVGNFWEIAWVVDEDPADGSDGAWLDQRKNWRSHWPAEPEEGDKCRLMGFWQEISGYSRLGGHAQQDAFWAAMQKKVGPLNLRVDERLCAIALVKRLFPLLDNIEEVIGFKPGGDDINVRNWPSTSYVAAVPWLMTIDDERHADARKQYERAVADGLGGGYQGETETRLFPLPNGGLFDFDGHLLHEDGIRAWPEEGLKPGASRSELAEALKDLRRATKTEPPSEFYALLKMDGDRIGEQLRQNAEQVKAALARFTEKVTGYFMPGNEALGALIYAGGDDVLAMLPVDTAIDAAYDIRRLYDDAFKEAAREGGAEPLPATMSAAAVFAHFKIPLRQVMRVAEHQLDAIAKERNGRDSLALCALKPGGLACEWVSCWSDGKEEPGRVLAQIAGTMRGAAPDFAAGFFHKLRDRYAPIFDHGPGDHPDRMTLELTGNASLMEALVRAEYARSPEMGFDRAKLERSVQDFMTISRPLRREGGKVKPSGAFSFDAGLMVRFLSQQGRWEAAR